VRRSQRVQNLSKPPVQKRHISEVEISDSLDDKESNAREAKTKNESFDRSPKKLEEGKEPSNKYLAKLQHKKDRKREKK